MARLRQQNPQNYNSSGNIHTDFENIIRYLNAGELGNKTIAELLAQLFNADGNFDGPIELRLNNSQGLEYRVGEYRNAEDGWLLLVPVEDIRGPAGENLGLIEGPLFYNRLDFVAVSNGTTAISYAFDTDVADIMVFVNGLILRGSGTPEYTYNVNTNIVTLTNAVDIGDKVTIISIRDNAVSNYRRFDFTAPSTTASIPFAHDESERLLVYKNGVLQREGASYDYVRNSSTDTITFITPLLTNGTATVLTVENQAQVKVAGLMLEDQYTDGNGFIDYAKIVVDDGDIAQAKVSGLVAALTSKAKITVSNTTPSSPVSGDFWLDTSVMPNVLKFYQGTQWLSASPDNGLPSFVVANAGDYLRVNGTGTALEYGDIDFTALVPKTYMGAANGVASLDSSGKIPTAQLPEIYSVGTIPFFQSGSLTNTTYRASSIYKQKIRIDGLSAVTSAGTVTIQIAVDGTPVGTTYAVTSTRLNQSISPVIEIDGTTAGKVIQIVTTSNSSGANLEVSLAYATLST